MGKKFNGLKKPQSKKWILLPPYHFFNFFALWYLGPVFNFLAAGPNWLSFRVGREKKDFNP